MNVASPTVLRIVVASTGFDVVGKRLRYRAPVGPVSADQVGHVVADHPAEPPHLVALVGQVVAYISGCHDADGQPVGVATSFGGSSTHRADGPFGDLRVG